ncbi:hypothetical protein ABB02_01162 [Clostridiaceae bacterium JG1575]|nr:hypothetical protein ABB02_01162 [Clostridiaceae bacterium JG1575]
MTIENTVTTPDFVELQKILLEEYAPDKTMNFLLKYVVNALYAMVVFLGFYFILDRMAQVKNLWIPGATAVVSFLILIRFHKRIYKNRLNKAIERYYGKTALTIHRTLTLDEDGVRSQEHDEAGALVGEGKYLLWSDFEGATRSHDNFFLKIKNQQEGFILKAEGLDAQDQQTVETYIRRIGAPIAERS